MVEIYLIPPDGTGLNRISQHGNFCGGPKWTPDSRSVIVYCMAAEETWTYRWGDQDGETRLVQIDTQTGATKALTAGAGVKTSPSILPSGEIGYLRRDKSANGVFYASGRQGPAGSDLYGPSSEEIAESSDLRARRRREEFIVRVSAPNLDRLRLAAVL